MKILILIAVVLAAVNADSSCPGFDPIVECDHCLQSESYHYYTVNPCNKNIFYNCEKVRGAIVAHEQRCPKCFWFSKDTWGCTDRDTDPACVPDIEPAFTENIGGWGDCCYREAVGPAGPYRQDYKVVTDAALTAPFDPSLYYYWLVNGALLLFACPDGTYFDLPTCQCQNCFPGNAAFPCLKSDNKAFCLDFDNKGSERGIWYLQNDQCGIDGWSYDAAAGNSLHASGAPCDIEVPFFQNNEFREFKLCGSFSTVNANLDQGIAFNGGQPGDDCYPGSIEISLKGGQVFAQIKTDDGDFPLTGPAISSNTWYDVCLSYDGKTLELSLGGSVVASRAATGVTLRNKCNFLFGANFDSFGNQNFFRGNLDDLCFWRKP